MWKGGSEDGRATVGSLEGLTVLTLRWRVTVAASTESAARLEMVSSRSRSRKLALARIVWGIPSAGEGVSISLNKMPEGPKPVKSLATPLMALSALPRTPDLPPRSSECHSEVSYLWMWCSPTSADDA